MPKRLSDLGLHARDRTNLISLFTDEATPLVSLDHIGGWLVGRLFRRSDNAPVHHLDHSEQALIAGTDGQHLVDHFWGSYAALWCSADGACRVLRDPSATMPVYVVTVPTPTVASNLDLLIAADAVRLKVDWATLSHGLRFPLLPTARTCIDGLTEVLPGEVSTLADIADTRLLWHPASFLQPSDSPCVPDALCVKLAGVIDGVVSAWSHCFSGALLELSGGLDSSVLAASLARSGTKWSAATVATLSLEGDERRYAALVADHCGVPLAEYDLGPTAIHPLEPSERLAVRPTGVRVLQGLDRIFRKARHDTLSDVSFSGTGGDNIFAYLRSTAPVLDAFAAGGVTLALGAFTNLIQFSAVTAWEAAASLGRRWWRERHATSPWLANDLLLTRDALAPCRNHPWLEAPQRMASGQRAHIRSLIGAHPIISGHPRATLSTMVFPLLSQPVMEACLAIPSWQWVAGGQDREPVRRAFARRLPGPVLARRHKGHLASVVTMAFERDRGRIRKLLLDGRLVSAGLVEARAITHAFAASNSIDALLQNRLLDLADAELWVREIEGLRTAPALGQ